MKVLFVTGHDATTAFLFEHITNNNEPNIEAYTLCIHPEMNIADSVRQRLVEHGLNESAIKVCDWQQQNDLDPDFVIYLGKEFEDSSLVIPSVNPVTKIIWALPETRWSELSGSKLTQHLLDLFKTIRCFMDSVELLFKSRVSKSIIEHHMQRLSYLV